MQEPLKRFCVISRKISESHFNFRFGQAFECEQQYGGMFDAGQVYICTITNGQLYSLYLQSEWGILFTYVTDAGSGPRCDETRGHSVICFYMHCTFPMH